jgi:hypothetical protein
LTAYNREMCGFCAQWAFWKSHPGWPVKAAAGAMAAWVTPVDEHDDSEMAKLDRGFKRE